MNRMNADQETNSIGVDPRLSAACGVPLLRQPEVRHFHLKESVVAKKVNKRSNRYPVGFQRDAVERMKHCEDVGELAEQLGVSRGALYLWKRKAQGLLSYRDGRPQRPCGSGRRPAGEEDPRTGSPSGKPRGRTGTAQPGSKFFQKCLAKSRGIAPAERRAWRNSIYDEICGWESQGQLTIQQMCDLAGVSRASFYRDWEQKAPSEAEMALRDAIQRTALAHRDHGYRRITPLLQRAGFVVGRRRSGASYGAIICWRCAVASSS